MIHRRDLKFGAGRGSDTEGAGARKSRPTPSAARVYCDRLAKGDCDDTDRCRAEGCRWIDQPSAATDPEIVAVDAIAAALQPLDRAACTRVLKWAEARYTQLHVLDGDLEAFQKFVDALVEASKSIGEVAPIEIVRFAENVQRYERERVAALAEGNGES